MEDLSKVTCPVCRKEYDFDTLRIRVDGVTKQRYLSCVCGKTTALPKPQSTAA